MTTPAVSVNGAFSRRSAARMVTAVASTSGLLAGVGLAAAVPAYAATAADCAIGNTVSTGVAADIQALLDDPAVPVICLEGTFVLPGSLTVGRDVTIFGLTNAVLDGDGQWRILDEVDEAIALTVQNLTLVDGFAEFGDGGAIQADSVTVIDSTFRSNLASNFGGAIWANSGVTVTGSTFDGNGAGDGGAIAGYGAFEISGSTFLGNDAEYDGGAVFGYNAVSVTDSTFVENTAGDDGGAIQGLDSVTVTSSTFSANTADFYGGAVRGDSTTVTNSTFVGNAAGDEGGAMFTGQSFVQFSTFLDNTAAVPAPEGELPGEAIYLQVFDFETLAIRGNVFAGSSGSPQLGVGNVIQPDSIVDLGGNVFSTARAVEADLTNPDPSTQFGKSPAQIFGASPALADNGGPTETLALVAGSPAIDAVPALAFVSAPAAAELSSAAIAETDVDQRGEARTGLLDAGAYEFGDAELAATGADTVTASWLAGIAAALVALGAAVVLTARRRARR